MSNLYKDRERAFEAEFAHEEETKFRAKTRQIRELGTWACVQLGKNPLQTEAYISALVNDFINDPEEGNLIAKINQDLVSGRLPISKAQIVEQQALIQQKFS